MAVGRSKCRILHLEATEAEVKVFGGAADYAPLTPFEGFGSSCKNLTAPDTVETLLNNVFGDGGACFTINASNVTLNGNGYRVINGHVLVGADNAKVVNLGVEFSTGIVVNGSSYGNYSNLNITNASNVGMWLASSSRFNNFTNVTVLGSGQAFRIDGEAANPVAVNYCRLG